MATTTQTLLDTVGGLSSPSKMPTLSWSTPASECLTGSKLARDAGTICGSCYARRGAYAYPSGRVATARRMALLRDALSDPAKLQGFEDAFVGLFALRLERTRRMLARTGRPGRDDGRFWRWHDSGDVHGIEHLRLLVRLARRAPGVSFWLPTKEAGTVRQFLAEGGEFPINLRVRLSVPRIGRGVPPAYARLAALSPQVTFAAAHEDAPPAGFEACRAPSQGGECRTCRLCWSDAAVSYHVH